MSVLSVHHRLEGRSCVHLVLPFLVRIDKVSLYVGSGLQYLFSLFQSHDHKCRSVCVGGGAVFGHYGGRHTLGNTAGGMTCYYMGRLGKISWIEKYFKVKKEKVDKMVKFLQGKGALMAFFAFLPAIGEVISIALGFMRSNIWLTTASMFVGKLIRYILLLYVLESAWNVVAG